MVETSIFDALKDLVNGRCYPMTLPQNPTYPSIVYARVGSTPANVLEGGSTIDHVRIQVDAFAKTYDAAKTLAASVRSAMEAAEFKATLQLDFDYYEPELDLYQVTQDFYVWQK